MIPWKPGQGSTEPPTTPVLRLRDVYVQSTPKPPPSLTALSAQGTEAGRLALHAWYDDQAAQARKRGYTFPFRLARWTSPDNDRKDERQKSWGSILASILGRGGAVGLADISRSGDAQLTAEHSISFTVEEAAAPMRMVDGASAGFAAQMASAQGAERVRATGTSRLLHQMRDRYLRSSHGRRHSYWSDTPERGTPFNDYYYNRRFAKAGAASRVKSNQDNGDSDSDDDDYPLPPPEDSPPVGKWEYYVEDGLKVPNITHKPTLVSIARMAANAYQPMDSDTWEKLGDRWDTHDSFGWQSDGIRGHVFADSDNKTVVISFKGTSSTFFLGGGSETSAKDKYNDNRLFSCCCAYVDFTWSTVCGCHISGTKCNATCLQDDLSDEAADNYFFAAAQMFMDVTDRYPDADVILTGHSLGGSIVGLLGLTFGVPAVGIEAPGDKLAAKRLHLPSPPAMIMDRLPLFHVGNTADPVFMGVCSGRTSSCYYAGYAMESKCHLGRQMVFDTVGRRDWRMDIRHHRINEIIYLVFEPWGNLDPEEAIPELEREDKDCVDCGLWKFVDEDSPQ
ncbi:alpha/beta-hydrolase [Martensiomyces pterosporus]|nr:alpha/beta-hydrolase [Martensiomyces pterosporus]